MTQKALRILVVEDNRDAAESLAVLVGVYGHEATVAEDGARGLALVRTQPFDVVLMDIGLPDMDGYAVARLLRADPAGGGLRLVALTGYDRAEDRQRAVESGFDMHIVKPIDPNLLRDLLAAWNAP